MTTTEAVAPDVAAQIVLAFVASKHEPVGESLIRDALSPHMTQAEMRAGLDLLLRAGKVKIIRPGIYEFVEPKPEPTGPDVSALIMAYAYGRGAGSTFDLADVLALPMIAHVPAGDITASLSRLVADKHLNDSPAGWSVPAPTGPERELIERLAAWFGMLDAGTSVTWDVIGAKFGSTPSYVLRTALDYLTRESRITRVRAGTYMRAA